ncbi:hypothetical protein GCM10017774_91970 [Lentzea cavernae]|uniref:Coenzyme PQQ synthesis protein A n=1 Tax=Lentzea cavernae TaxID=2020703 RepID=A0ABQ3MUD6_9PSEU|nr:hypothetical protein GCM10017774_91970 [Lentzea cavernae]
MWFAAAPPRKALARPSRARRQETEELRMNVAVTTTETKLPEVRREWVKPDFRDFETPMEITAYAARS